MFGHLVHLHLVHLLHEPTPKCGEIPVLQPVRTQMSFNIQPIQRAQ